jgi:hypothetical protein
MASGVGQSSSSGVSGSRSSRCPPGISGSAKEYQAQHVQVFRHERGRRAMSSSRTG